MTSNFATAYSVLKITNSLVHQYIGRAEFVWSTSGVTDDYWPHSKLGRGLRIQSKPVIIGVRENAPGKHLDEGYQFAHALDWQMMLNNPLLVQNTQTDLKLIKTSRLPPNIQRLIVDPKEALLKVNWKGEIEVNAGNWYSTDLNERIQNLHPRMNGMIVPPSPKVDDEARLPLYHTSITQNLAQYTCSALYHRFALEARKKQSEFHQQKLQSISLIPARNLEELMRMFMQ